MKNEAWKQSKKEKRKTKRAAQGLPIRKEGSLRSEMEHRIRQRAKKENAQLTHCYRDRAIAACKQFDEWRKISGWTNAQVREHRSEAVKEWVTFLNRDLTEEEKKLYTKRRKTEAYQSASVHTMTAYVCLGLGIEMNGISRVGSAMDKKKSTGENERAEQARRKKENAGIVRFAELVGGRRTAYTKLTGADFIRDESGEYCVRFIKDKGGKTQYQRIAPEDIAEVRAYFENKASDERIFPEPIDKNLDLHGIRAEHARQEYKRYQEICSTEEGRAEMRRQLWKRFTDPMIGNTAWLRAKQEGNIQKMKRKEREFIQEMSDKPYVLRGDNRTVAEYNHRPLEYDRLALCCVSVFALSHWRNEVTVKHYMI